MRTTAWGRLTLVKLGPQPKTSGCAPLLPPVPLLLHIVVPVPTALIMLAVVDEDEKVVDLSPTSIVDKEEVVDRLEPHLRLQMDVRILSPEVNAVHLHNWFHSDTCLESPTRGLLVRTTKS